jgi:hypothetical protein
MFTRRRYERIAIPVLLAGVVVFASSRERVQLRPDMPPTFTPRSVAAGGREDSEEERRIARAYWDCAIEVVQPERGYRMNLPLPRSAPAEFSIAAQRGSQTPEEAAARDHYWNELREIWFQESTWVRWREWDFSWLRNPIQATAGWLQDQARGLGSP